MRIDVNGARLWFDVDGLSLVPDGARLRSRPTVVLVHGGPAIYDHSYLRPHFGRLAAVAQVVYLDLRDHGRSSRHAPGRSSLVAYANDLRAFCDALGISRPVVIGHSFGGAVAMLYGADHPGHAGGLVLLSAMARFDLDRLTEGFRGVAGDEVACLARNVYSGQPVSDEEFDRVFTATGPNRPPAEELARRIVNTDLIGPGLAMLSRLDVVEHLPRITSPTLASAGDLDPLTPVGAAEEIIGALPPGLGRLDVIPKGGHFPWLDNPDHLWPVLTEFVATVAG